MPKRDADYMAGKRREILTAARRVAARKGLAHTSMRDIAEAAGLSLGALATHFENREALIAFAASEAKTQRVAAIGAMVADGVSGTTLARLLTAPETAAALALDVDLVAEARCTPALRTIAGAGAEDAVAGLADVVGDAGAARMVVALTYGLGAMAALGVMVSEADVARALTALMAGDEG